MRIIVCDAGPLIHLSEADCLDLLRPAGNLFLPHRVAIEIQTVVAAPEPWPAFLQIVELEPHERKRADMWQAAGDLHAGEAEALVLARRKKADWFLTDDATTRLFVSLLGLEVHGSLGIILWNAAKGYLSRDEANSIATDLLNDISVEAVSEEVTDLILGVGLEVLGNRAGKQPWGYVEPGEAAWEVLEESIEGIEKEMEKRMQAGLERSAEKLCQGLLSDSITRWRPTATDRWLGRLTSQSRLLHEPCRIC